MAFDTFDISPQVITSTDYDKIRIHAGEEANTNNFNRNVVDSINRDAMMEAAVTYMARSSSLFTTDNTRFLSHCEGDGVDVVSYNSPVLTTGSEDVFVDDDTFLGACIAQPAVTNLLSNTDIDQSISTLTGWSTHANPESAKGNAHCTISPALKGGMKITNKAATATVLAEDVYLVSDKVDISQRDVDVLSASVYLSTDTNMLATGITSYIHVVFYNAEGARISTIKNEGKYEVQAPQYEGVLASEGVAIPEDAASVTICVHIVFPENAKGEFVIKNAMLQYGGSIQPYTGSIRQACTAAYAGVRPAGKEFNSVLSWFKPNAYALSTHANPTGPVFLRNYILGTTMGGIHEAKDGANLTFKIYVKTSITEYYGDEFTLPDRYLGKYLLSAVRFRVSEFDDSVMICEFSVVAGFEIYKSTVEVPVEVFTGSMDLIVGTDLDTFDYFNSPVTELRYDEEWINDLELYVISLAHKAFSFKTSNDLYALGRSGKDDSVNYNLIPNPSGNLAYVGWNDYDKAYFSPSYTDPMLGTCFVWVGTPDSYTKIVSDPIPILNSTEYTLQGVMYSDAGSSGSAGIGLEFLDSDLNVVGDTLTADIYHDGQVSQYTLANISPATAVYASVFMYVDTDIVTTRLTWSKLKLEQGSASHYTRDAGADYALYYDEDEVVTGDNSDESKFLQRIVDIVYPVGAIYISASNVAPNTLFGGTWEQLSSGVVLQNVGDDTTVGTEIPAGLPNIRGIFPTVDMGSIELPVGATRLYYDDLESELNGNSGKGFSYAAAIFAATPYVAASSTTWAAIKSKLLETAKTRDRGQLDPLDSSTGWSQDLDVLGMGGTSYLDSTKAKENWMTVTGDSNVPSLQTMNDYEVEFNASIYNSIYGNSNTVQPHALTVNMWKRVK